MGSEGWGEAHGRCVSPVSRPPVEVAATPLETVRHETQQRATPSSSSASSLIAAGDGEGGGEAASEAEAEAEADGEGGGEGGEEVAVEV